MSNLISTQWLIQHILDENLIILDATIPKATDKNRIIETGCIPNSIWFDLKKNFSQQDTNLPNTVPTATTFQKGIEKLGINSNSKIIIYDKHGVYSSPRAWWLFKLMGHQNVFILDGGLPKWIAENNKIEQSYRTPITKGDFRVDYQPTLFKDKQAVLKNINNSETLILDARSEKRFLGLIEEPRPALRAGHIPNSKNLHYSHLTDTTNCILKPKDLKIIFDNYNTKNRHIIYSCGSGITACILAFCANEIGLDNYSIYDGSWTEWGTLTNLPIEN